MKKLEAYALLAFEEDIRSRTIMDWLRAHTSFMKPLHRYEGVIILDQLRFIFQGIDVKTREPYELVIGKDEFEQIYYGFDEAFSIWEVRSMGIQWKPLRITFNKGNGDVYVYLIVNFRYGFSDNKQWYEILKNWVT